MMMLNSKDYANTIVEGCNVKESQCRKRLAGIRCCSSQQPPFSCYYHDPKWKEFQSNCYLNKQMTLERQLLQPIKISYKNLLKISLHIEDHVVARLAILQKLRQDFSHEAHLHDSIRMFSKYSQFSEAVYWYTKDSFVYRLINSVLRSGSMGEFYFVRSFIADLSAQLLELKRQQQLNGTDSSECILYRGLRESKSNLQLLSDLVGHVVKAKTFLSTTRKRHIALLFAGTLDSQNPDEQPLLLQIKVNLSSPAIIAPDISHLSNFPEELEILFDFGVSLRIDSLVLDSSSNVWLCQLTAIADESSQLHLIENGLLGDPNFESKLYNDLEIRMNRLKQLVRRRNYQSTYIYRGSNTVWQNLSEKSWIANSCAEIACIRHQRVILRWHWNRNYNSTVSDIKQLWKLYDRLSDIQFMNSGNAALFLHHIGYIFRMMGDSVHSIDLFKYALYIHFRARSPKIFISQTLRNLGLAYAEEGTCKKALDYLSRALTIDKQIQPAVQWNTCMCLRNIGLAYHHKGDYKQAAAYFFECLNVFQRSTDPTQNLS